MAELLLTPSTRLQETKADKLTKEEFLHFCQRHFLQVGQSVFFSVIILFVICPALGTRIKRGLLAIGALARPFSRFFWLSQSSARQLTRGRPSCSPELIRERVSTLPDTMFISIAGTLFAQVQAALQVRRNRVRLAHLVAHLAMAWAAWKLSHYPPVAGWLAETKAGLEQARERAARAVSVVDDTLGLAPTRSRAT